MSWREEVDRTIAERRQELLSNLVRDSANITGNLKEAAGICAATHPMLYLASGVAVGACMTIAGPAAGGRAANLTRGVVSSLWSWGLGRVLPR